MQAARVKAGVVFSLRALAAALLEACFAWVDCGQDADPHQNPDGAEAVL